jgi:hypothetical protein|tara:strand:- start:54 stop:509 length:456 start_codon:yes stop_codon:yes gene_type:complete
MATFDITLDELLIEINQSINEKIIGTNFLELFKFQLIEKFKFLEKNDLNSLKLMPNNGTILEKEINLNNRKIKYKVEYFDKSTSKIKEKIDNNYLWLILEGLKSITIYDFNYEDRSIFSNLSKNMGIVLSLNTVITSRIAEKSIILSISSN